MATTISPAVSRVADRQWISYVGAHGFGVMVGASLAFVVLASFAAGTEAMGGLFLWALIGASVVLLAVMRDVGLNVPVPYRNVQVPQVLRYLLPHSSLFAVYGVQLGLGFLTRYTYSTHTAVMVALPLVVASPLLVLGSIFALAVGKSLVLLAAVGTSADEGPFEGRGGARTSAGGVRLMRYTNVLLAVALTATTLHQGGVF